MKWNFLDILSYIGIYFQLKFFSLLKAIKNCNRGKDVGSLPFLRLNFPFLRSLLYFPKIQVT